MPMWIYIETFFHSPRVGNSILLCVAESILFEFLCDARPLTEEKQFSSIGKEVPSTKRAHFTIISVIGQFHSSGANSSSWLRPVHYIIVWILLFPFICECECFNLFLWVKIAHMRDPWTLSAWWNQLNRATRSTMVLSAVAFVGQHSNPSYYVLKTEAQAWCSGHLSAHIL